MPSPSKECLLLSNNRIDIERVRVSRRHRFERNLELHLLAVSYVLEICSDIMIRAVAEENFDRQIDVRRPLAL